MLTTIVSKFLFFNETSFLYHDKFFDFHLKHPQNIPTQAFIMKISTTMFLSKSKIK